ncbi:unnamed protein product [Macrosiphum euphorbiae]|uniref:Retrotransposon gag domain-containing protein n=1 Tax=Macrosiphum euphorbiae TaxID=13131 RepID=A0AAV0WQ51_9HEMI|nr:unnamed protein product [Macrosiphum euphorbiae]
MPRPPEDRVQGRNRLVRPTHGVSYPCYVLRVDNVYFESCCRRFDTDLNVGNDSPPTNAQNIQAPTYNELFDLAQSLKSRLELLEKNAGNVVTTQPQTQPTGNSVPHTYSDYRMLPDLNRTVPEFTGHESSCAAEDWLSNVDALAGINNWSIPYRLQFVKSNMTNAARIWYLTEVFMDWSDFKVKFRSAFVRTLRMTDLWKALSERLQVETEHIAHYF